MRYNEYQKVAQNIMNLYAVMDKENDNFSKISGLGCVSTCGGVCCQNKEVEVSPVDLIPLVLHLIETSQIEEKMNLAQSNADQSCLFYKFGKCSIYTQRATLCRLFGYSSIYNKKNEKVLSVCSYIKEEQSTLICPLQVETAPNLVDWAGKVRNLVPSWDQNTLPFNQAFLYAANRILNSYNYEGEE